MLKLSSNKVARQYLAQVLLLITVLKQGEALKLNQVKIIKKGKTKNGFLFEVVVPDDITIEDVINEILE